MISQHQCIPTILVAELRICCERPRHPLCTCHIVRDKSDTYFSASHVISSISVATIHSSAETVMKALRVDQTRFFLIKYGYLCPHTNQTRRMQSAAMSASSGARRRRVKAQFPSPTCVRGQSLYGEWDFRRLSYCSGRRQRETFVV